MEPNQQNDNEIMETIVVFMLARLMPINQIVHINRTHFVC